MVRLTTVDECFLDSCRTQAQERRARQRQEQRKELAQRIETCLHFPVSPERISWIESFGTLEEATPLFQTPCALLSLGPIHVGFGGGALRYGTLVGRTHCPECLAPFTRLLIGPADLGDLLLAVEGCRHGRKETP